MKISISVLHVAMEGGAAVFGGLGRVATQMAAAQNCFVTQSKPILQASIITPYYPSLHKNYLNQELVAEVWHLYDNRQLKSKIYLAQNGQTKHYLIEPPDEYRHLFNINYLPEIYADLEHSYFIDRVKFFNSCVAAYVAQPDLGVNHPRPEILQLHDWQAAIVPKLLKELHHNFSIKTVFTVHIDNGDRGTYPTTMLSGIGLKFKKEACILKAMGLIYADKIVGVSPKFLRECIQAQSDSPELEFLRKIFAWSSVRNKTIGIGNGINYADFCPMGKYIHGINNIDDQKTKLTHLIAAKLRDKRLSWQFDPSLPLILYVGRYSPEKGVEVFEQIIQAVNGRAIFVAVGRGMTSDVFQVIIRHSRQTDNVFITASEIEQAELLPLLRAAAKIIILPSHRDAFGLVGPESLANGCVLVTTGVGGLSDVATPLDTTDKNKTRGNAILYEDMPSGDYNPDLTVAINRSLDLWNELSPAQISAMQKRIMQEAEQFDWNAPNGAVAQYLDIYEELLRPTPAIIAKTVPRPRP